MWTTWVAEQERVTSFLGKKKLTRPIVVNNRCWQLQHRLQLSVTQDSACFVLERGHWGCLCQHCHMMKKYQQASWLAPVPSLARINTKIPSFLCCLLAISCRTLTRQYQQASSACTKSGQDWFKNSQLHPGCHSQTIRVAQRPVLGCLNWYRINVLFFFLYASPIA